MCLGSSLLFIKETFLGTRIVADFTLKRLSSEGILNPWGQEPWSKGSKHLLLPLCSLLVHPQLGPTYTAGLADDPGVLSQRGCHYNDKDDANS